MAYPEQPAFYPVMSMPCGNSATLLRNTNRPVMRNGPPPPPPPFLEQGYPPPPPGMGFPFPPPSPNGARFPPPPPPPSNMEHNLAAPMPFKPFPPSNRQGPLTPPSSAPPTPLPVLELNQQNEILTQKWQWLPSMLCSIADDPTGDVYKIITITWDGSCKDCYLKRVGEGGVIADKGKDVFEKDLIPIGRRDAMPPPPPCREFTPPLSERGFSPPPSDSGFDHGAPIMVNHHNGGGPGPGPAFNGGFQNGPPPFPGPRPAQMEEYTSDDNDEDDGYEARPPLSPAMAARGIFPVDEEYYSSSSPNWNSSSDDFSNDHDQGFIAIRLPDREPGHHESSSSLAKKSSGSGKKHKKRHHGERSASENKERGSEKGGAKKSSSKGRSRRGSTSGNSNKSEDEKKEKKGSSSGHRGRREKHGGGKPGLFYFGS